MKNSLHKAAGAILVTIFMSDSLVGQQRAMMFEGTMKKEVNAGYLISYPKEYDSGKVKKWPLILFLHGSGERGNDLELVKKHGPPKLVAEGQQLDFVIVSPQCPELEDWSTDVLISLLEDVIEKNRIDTNRIYLTGLSMGGWGTWNLAIEHPDKFAAIAPVCGRVDRNALAKASRLQNVPAWVFHGAMDPVVPVTESGRMVSELRKIDAPVRFTVYPEVGHDSWTETYVNAELYNWFLSHSKSHGSSDLEE